MTKYSFHCGVTMESLDTFLQTTSHIWICLRFTKNVDIKFSVNDSFWE